MKIEIPFKVGDWVMSKKEYRTKESHPLEIVKMDYDKGKAYVRFDNWAHPIMTECFDFATDAEIKIQKIKNMFAKQINKKTGHNA